MLLKALRYVLVLPIVLVVGPPFLAIGGLLIVYSYVPAVTGAWRLRRKMARTRRLIRESCLREKVRAEPQPGTLICESYTLGWPFARIWWTPESLTIPDLSQTEAEGDDPIDKASGPYQQWVLDTYADVERGKALLVRAWISKRTFTELEKLFPKVPIFNLWSGAIFMRRRMDAKQAGSDSSTKPAG